jgi:hypothetical protein
MGDKVSKSVIIATNVVSKINMALSYCFPRDEAKDISLTVSRESAFLEEGRQWGAVQLQIQLEESDFPIQTSNRHVRAINAIPKGLLDDRQIDPDSLDITILNGDRLRLRDMYMEGDLADETEPIKNKTEAVKYAKSSLAGPKGKRQIQSAAPGWDFMSDKRVEGIGAGLNSVEPSEADSTEDEPYVMSDLAKTMLNQQRKENAKSTPLTPTIVSPSTLKSAMKSDSSESPISTPKEYRKVTVIDPGDEDLDLP